MKKPKYDVIGYWSELKLDIIREYASAYSRIMGAQSSIRKHIYIDAFAGAGHHISKSTGNFVPGSPLNALLVEPPFSEFHLIDLDGDKTAELRRIVGARSDVEIYDEDANQVLLFQMPKFCEWTKRGAIIHGVISDIGKSADSSVILSKRLTTKLFLKLLGSD